MRPTLPWEQTMNVLKFIKPSGKYAAGDVAGFDSDAQADAIIKSGAAVRYESEAGGAQTGAPVAVSSVKAATAGKAASGRQSKKAEAGGVADTGTGADEAFSSGDVGTTLAGNIVDGSVAGADAIFAAGDAGAATGGE